MCQSNTWDMNPKKFSKKLYRMNMGMIIQTSGVCMQHHRHADLHSQVFPVQAEVFQSAKTFEQECISRFLIERRPTLYPRQSRGRPLLHVPLKCRAERQFMRSHH